MNLAQNEDLLKLKMNEMVDIFAVYDLFTDPKIKPESIGVNMPFGFRETYNGLGVFVFKENDNYKIVAMENQGNEQVSLAKLAKSFQSGINSCIIKNPGAYEQKFVLRMKAEGQQLMVSYGDKKRSSSQTVCFEGLELKNLSKRNYLGVTARNNDRYVKDV